MTDFIRTRKVKTMYRDRVWVHEKYYHHIMDGGTLLIPVEVQGKKGGILDGTMTITKDNIARYEMRRGRDRYPEQHGHGFYYLYGFKYLPDQSSLF